MNNDLVNAENTGDNTPAQPAGDKVFTQDDVNKIVSDRLNKEKQKLMADVEKQKAELQQQSFLITAQTTLQSKGYPTELLNALNTSTPEAFANSLELIEKHLTKISTPARTLDTGMYHSKVAPQGVDPVKKAMGLK